MSSMALTEIPQLLWVVPQVRYLGGNGGGFGFGCFLSSASSSCFNDSVAVRLAGGGDSKRTTAGKPCCYRARQ
ncbi:hypothetical protein D3M70_02595 [Pseudomonas sp. LS-2]|nr:hypothetical protein D3M70_02595 [Pseudomonas sp. LS-2]